MIYSPKIPGYFAAAALALAMATSLSASPLTNPNFESGSGSTSFSGLGAFSTPAAGWSGWNNTAVLTTLDLVPTTLPLAGAGSQMLHISSTGDNNGIYQVFGGSTWYAGAWFYVNSGSGFLLLVDNYLYPRATTAHQNQWEFVQFNAPVSSYELTIYTGTGGGDFYVDLVDVDTNPLVPGTLPSQVPEPASVLLSAIGLGAFFAVARRRGLSFTS